VIAHGEVDHAAFAGGHRRKLIRLAGLAHAFGGDFGCEFQLLGSQRLEIHAIEAELVVLLRFQAEHFQGHMLQRAQELAIALQKQRAIGPSKFDDDFRALSDRGIHRRIRPDAVLQAKSGHLNGVAQDFVNTSGGGNSILNRHGWGTVTSASY